MPKDINTVSLFGNATRFELRYTDRGTAILDICVAGEEKVVTNQNKEVAIPFYMNTSIVGKGAEELAEDLKEDGTSIVHIAGELQHRKWTDKNGVEQQRLFIVGQNAQLVINAPDLGFSKDAGGNARYRGGHARATVTARVVGDPELRFTKSGDGFMGVRTNVRGAPVNVDGKWESPANWMKMTLWRDMAEAANNLGITKGNEFYAEGRLQMGQDWTDKDGNKRRGEVEFSPINITWMKGRGSDGGSRPAPAAPKWDDDSTSAFGGDDDAVF